MTTVVFTDGACSGNPGPGGWAWAVPDGPFAAGPADHTTNQRMEVTAVLEALRSLEGEVEVVSDSTYVINCFRDRWWEGWLKRGWLNSQKKPVANRDLWEPLVELVQTRKNEISFRWVKGHSGDPMNDLVDALAVEAAATQQPKSGAKAPASATSKPKTSTSGPELPDGHLLLVAGHKPPEIGGYGDNPIASRLRDKLSEVIRAKASMHPDLKVVSAMGLGVDQLGVEAAVDAGIPVIAVLPFPDQHQVWPGESQRRFDELMAKVEGEVLLQANAPKSKQEAGGALNRANAWLASRVDEAVVVWDGDEQYVGRVVRSLQDALGETEVFVIEP
jgi:ribonuclease HI/uncharacterized phage-like protein YoqJ